MPSPRNFCEPTDISLFHGERNYRAAGAVVRHTVLSLTISHAVPVPRCRVYLDGKTTLHHRAATIQSNSRKSRGRNGVRRHRSRVVARNVTSNGACRRVPGVRARPRWVRGMETSPTGPGRAIFRNVSVPGYDRFPERLEAGSISSFYRSTGRPTRSRTIFIRFAAA